MSREEGKTSVALQAIPDIDSAMICMEVEELVRLAEDEKVWQQPNELNQHWNKEIISVMDNTSDNLADTLEHVISSSEYLKEPGIRQYIQSRVLYSMVVSWHKQMLEEHISGQ